MSGASYRGQTSSGGSVRYRTIVADPPWDYPEPMPSHLRGGVEHVALPYASMSMGELAELPVAELADPSGAFLFCWTTNRYLNEAFRLVDAWGFWYRQTIVWHKTGCPTPFAAAFAPNHAEFLLVCRRGQARRLGTLPSSVVAAPTQTEHSRKPDMFLDLIEEIAPAPRIELFARRQRLGWDTWGNQALEHVELSA